MIKLIHSSTDVECNTIYNNNKKILHIAAVCLHPPQHYYYIINKLTKCTHTHNRLNIYISKCVSVLSSHISKRFLQEIFICKNCAFSPVGLPSLPRCCCCARFFFGLNVCTRKCRAAEQKTRVLLFERRKTNGSISDVCFLFISFALSLRFSNKT